VIAEKAQLVTKQELADAYGNIPMLEYERRKAIADGNEELSHETMREDYELGVDDGGWFEMRFSCYCTKCGLDFSFVHSEQIDLTIPDCEV
jgi:hypothetical protein